MDHDSPRHSTSRVLILTPPGGTGAIAELRAILEGAGRFSISVKDPPHPDVAHYLDVSSEPLCAILLVLGRHGLQEAERALRGLRERGSSTPVIIVAEEEMRPEQVERWLDRGASDFFVRPFRSAEVLPRLWRLASRRREEDEAVSRLKEKLGLSRIIGQTEVFMAQVRKIPTVARCPSSVLIQGETGTGKELVARSIHHLSARSSQPFIALSCAGIPESLAENELFGHAKGAYTGAAQRQRGLVAEADGGTLLLDDVDCLTPAIQAKLLRFLQDKEYRALGSPRLHKADVRIIASCNVDLRQKASSGRFRLDLFHRLNVVPIHLPPLRERIEDIPLLARHFLLRHAEELGVAPPRLPASVMELLLAYDWPGNVRELEHAIERGVILSRGDVIDPVALMLPLGERIDEPMSFKEAKARVVGRFERSYLERQLRAHAGNISRAARASGKHRRAFFELIRKHDIDVARFRP